MFERLTTLFWNATSAMSLRRWDAAKTDRLNSAQWGGAKTEKINEDLALDLPTLRKRCLYETENNPFLDGVIGTHQVDVVGSDGPTLQIQSDSEEYNRTAERIWKSWAEVCDLAEEDTLVEFLQRDIRMLWGAGEFLFQLVDIPREETTPGLPITLRLHEVHPRRLTNPIGSFDWRVCEGIERGNWGRPETYWIEDFITDQGLALGAGIGMPRPINRSNVIHGFRKVEPGQVRGYPIAAPCLQTISDVRAFDAEVLDAARAAAHLSVLLWTDHHQAKYIEVNESVEMERRTMRTLPPGWKASQMQGTQPAPNYIDYRGERLRELGRPAQMPLMMVRLDSSNHNYSSARFDAQRYDRANQTLQKWITRKKLTRLLRIVLRQAELEGLLPKRPKVVEYQWTWPVSPHVDPSKEADAWDTLLRLGIVSEFDAAAALGKDYETVVALRKRAQELREAAGLQESTEGDSPSAAPAETRKLIRRLVEEAFEGHRSRPGVFQGVLAS